jgi:hypothetical protein
MRGKCSIAVRLFVGTVSEEVEREIVVVVADIVKVVAGEVAQAEMDIVEGIVDTVKENVGGIEFEYLVSCP